MRRMVWPRRPHGSGVTVGVTAGVTRNVTPTEGGVLHQQQEGCYIPLFHLSPPLFGFFVLDRLTRAAPAEREKTGATPPFLPLVRHGEGGVTPVSISIPAGRLRARPRHERGRADERRDA